MSANHKTIISSRDRRVGTTVAEFAEFSFGHPRAIVNRCGRVPLIPCLVFVERTLMRTACLLCISLATISVGKADWNSSIAASNPLNWYRLDETAGNIAIDYGSEGLNGTYGVGAASPTLGANGLVGGAVEFDGSSRNILLNGSVLTGDWTAEFILKKTGTKSSAELIRGEPLEFPSSHLKLEQYPNTGQVGITESFVIDQVFTPPVVAPLDRFIHLAIVKNGLGTSAYLNGTLAGFTPSTVSLYRYQFGDMGTEAPIAVVDEIVVYSRALSGAELARHRSAIPEPASFVLLCLGSLCVLRRR